MKTKFRVWCLSAALAVIGSTITPAMADEWNKETRIEIKELVEIPGKVLMPGTYIFKLADGQSDQKTVLVLSEDAKGNQKFVTTVFAISAYSMETPDKVIIRVDERPSGTPPAIRTWFYPGANFGWEFVYPKSERLMVTQSDAPAEEPALAPSVEPALPEPPVEAAAVVPVLEEEEVLEEVAIVQEPTSFLISDNVEDLQASADRMLPETDGHSVANLAAGVTILGLGLIAVFAGLRKAQA